VDVLQVKGRSQPTVLIEVFEGDLPQLRMRKQAMLSTFEDAFQLYQAGQWTAAHRAFRAYHNDFPEDRLGLVFLERCTHFLADSPVAWDGTYAIAHK
jgi:adenylate cyclase